MTDKISLVAKILSVSTKKNISWTQTKPTAYKPALCLAKKIPEKRQMQKII